MKHIAFVLVITIICTMIPGAVFASADTVFYNESFNNLPTNSSPTSLTHVGDKTARVTDDGKNNKAFMMKSDVGNNLNISFKTDSSSAIVSFDIKMNDVRSKCTVTIGDSSKTFTAVTLNEDGSIVSHDGKRIGGIPRNKYTQISIGYNSKSHKYFFAQDGEIKISNWNSGSTVGKLTRASISASAADENGVIGTICIDNICVYGGDKIRKDIPKSAYSHETVEFVEPPIEEAGSEILLAKTFDEEVLSGLVSDAKNNVLEIRKEKNSNGYLYVNKTEATDPYISLTDIGGYGNYIVAQIDVRRVSGAPLIRLFQMRDVDRVINETITLSTSGNIQFPNSSVAGTIGNSWTTIAIACDFTKLTFDCYVDGKLVQKNVSMKKMEFGPLSSCRIYFESGNNGEVMFDNYFVYEGKEPRKIEVNNTVSEGYNISNTILPAIDKNANRLSGKTAFHVYSGAVYHNGIKEVFDDSMYPVGDTAMISADVLSKKLDLGVKTHQGTVTIDDKITFEAGKEIMKTHHGDVALSAVPVVKDDTMYIPLEDLFEKGLEKIVFKNNDGLIVVSDDEISWANDTTVVTDVNNYMFFNRKSASELESIFDSSGNSQKHPRIMADADTFARLRRECKTNSYVKKWNMDVISIADKCLTSPVNEYVIPDGLRLLDTSRAVLDYVMALGYAYQITGNRKYARRVWTELESAGNFVDWNPKHFLDVGEMTAAFAVGYDWCYNEFSDEERKFIEDRIINFGLLEGKKYYEGIRLGTDFVNSTVNWNVVCNGGLAMGAMAIADKYPDISFFTIECALRSLEKMLPGFAPDGGWGEGPGYWGYTVRYLAYFTDSLKHTMNTDFGLLKYKGISKTADYVINLHGHTASNAYHDTWSEMSINEYCTWVGSRFNRPDVTSIRLHIMDTLNISANVKDLLWYDSSVTTTDIMPPLDGYTKGPESGSMRTSWTDTDSMFVSYHGGKTNENHYHIDGGSFVLDMFGIRWAVDIGPGNYNDPGYFGTARDTYYRIRAEGHNTYVINPSESGGQDMDAFCPIIKSESKQKGGYQVLDMSTAYKQSVNSALRGYMLSGNRRTFTVQDEISLKDESEIYWFMHTYSNIEIVDSNTAILTQDGNKMQFRFITNADEASLSVMDAVPLETSPNPEVQSTNKGIRKIAIKLKAKGDVYITARVTPLYENGANEELVYTNIDNWVLEDGDISPLPEAQMMYIDGVPADNFSPRVTGYGVSLAYDYDHMPIPTLVAPGMVIETTEAKTVDDIWQFKVYRPGDEDNYRIYTFSYTVLQKLGDVEGYKRHTPAKIYASEVPEEENGPLSAIDEDLTSRWAASGTQWIEQDFGTTKKVDAVAMAFASGDVRSYSFKIEISSDGKNYQTVFDGASKGGTNEYEIFELGTGYSARYVRYTGSGNSVNLWNSITEFAVLETK